MDPYVYPGTNVLRNLRDFRDLDRLAHFEAQATSFRLWQLSHKPTVGIFDALHLQAIHRHIFQDVYEWAGKFRTVNMGKSAGFFALKEHIVSSLDRVLDELRAERYLANTGLERFCHRSAYYLGEVNAIHPFREGNGRAQRELIRQLASRNGYLLNWSRISKAQMVEASQQSFRGNNAGLDRLLRTAVEDDTCL